MFIAAVLFRIYWCVRRQPLRALARAASDHQEQRRDMSETLQFYFYLQARSSSPINGHNPLAALAYVILYLGFIVTILTGLGLFAWVIRTPPWTTLFGWTWSVMSIQRCGCCTSC